MLFIVNVVVVVVSNNSISVVVTVLELQDTSLKICKARSVTFYCDHNQQLVCVIYVSKYVGKSINACSLIICQSTRYIH